MRHALRISVGKPEEKRIPVAIDGRTILNFILEKWGLRMWTGLIWLRTVSSGRL
jgi:hypothetical protein